MRTQETSTGLFRRTSFTIPLTCCVLLLLFLTSCSELEKPKTEPFYAPTDPPEKREFRWSNGKMPKSFDPARAAAPPETDIVRALYEGLTDTDPKTLKTVPAVAIDWKSSEDQKVWTFRLRPDARWSNGERLTAADFVRSWKRLSELQEKGAHRSLLDNIVGMRKADEPAPSAAAEDDNLLSRFPLTPDQPGQFRPSSKPVATPEGPPAEASAKKAEDKLGVEAEDIYTLKVTLVDADPDFPSLVAHPIFRPIYGNGKEFEDDKLDAGIVTNGAFRIASVGPDGITLDRSDRYWNRSQIELERVRFVPKENAEKALEAYRAGEIDAVTNAEFEPLALKLLTPYDDFRRTTHSALNFYEFNLTKAPFRDRRVREAMAIAIERERLTEGEMEGATEPALGLLPYGEPTTGTRIVQDIEKARKLLAEAGFAGGDKFPTVRLVINRNDVQNRIAKAVARMWKQNLNIETEIVVREAAEIDDVRSAGDFDVLRRGVVLPTTSRAGSLRSILGHEESHKTDGAATASTPGDKAAPAENSNSVKRSISQHLNGETPDPGIVLSTEEMVIAEDADGSMTEEEAIAEMVAIPLYFPTSYSLVKPYIQGFEINTLDAPSLKHVRIDINWQPKKANGES